ncbi:MAG TPA: restriction endonuclease subunit S [Patescibacteria group bacterium]
MTWPTKKLGEVVELKYGKGISEESRKPDGRYPIFGANGEIDRTDKYLVEGQAIIVGRKGSAGELTRISGKFWPSDVTYYIFGNKNIDIDFLFYLLQSLNLKQFAAGVKPGINRNQVHDLDIPAPTLSDQKKVVKKIEGLFVRIDEAQKLRVESKKETSNLVQSVLNEVFINNTWPKKRLDDENILDMTSGGTPSRGDHSFYGGNIVWLKSGELNDNENIVDSEEHITDQAIKESSAKIFPENTVLFAMYGATAGKLGILGAAAATNQAVAGLIPNEKVLNNKYLFYCLKHIRETIVANAWGGAQPNLSQTIIKRFEIPVPPLSEQKKIVARLDLLSAKIRELQKLQSETEKDLKDLKQAILQKAFAGELI